MTSSHHRALDPVGPGSSERARELHTIPNGAQPALQSSTLRPIRLSPAIRRSGNSNTSIHGETLSRFANSRPERLALSLKRGSANPQVLVTTLTNHYAVSFDTLPIRQHGDIGRILVDESQRQGDISYQWQKN